MRNWILKTRRGRLDLGQTWGVWSHFRPYARPYLPHLAAALAAALGTVVLQIAAPWPIKIIFDHVLSDTLAPSWITRALDRVSSGPGSVLAWVCGAILVIAVLDAALSYARDVLLAQTGQCMVGKIRSDLFAHLQSLPPSAFERRRTGDLLMRLTGDIQMLRQMLVDAMVTLGQSGLLVAAMTAAMFWINPVLALLGLGTLPLLAWSSYRISRQIRKAAEGQREKESVVASLAHDVLGAMAIIQAFNREDIERKRFARQNRCSTRAGLKTTRLESKLYRIISLASAAGTCAILYVGVRFVISGSMTAGDLLVFISYLRTLNKPLRNVAKLAGQVAKATTCGQRVAEIFEIAPGVHDRKHALALDGVRGTIGFERIGFHYEDGTPALSDIDLQIAAGERIAVVGHTGAGKSTLLKLLLRFHDPREGRVLIDGKDLRDVALGSLRSRIGWVHQDTVLFGMSVAENIALGRPDAERGDIEDMARRVQADEFIRALPHGYDTVLGQGGTTLSGGQRQRLALARALLRNAPILLLDEPATGLDALTRELVERAWMSPENTATTVVICHRLNHMERFDRVVLLSEGRLAGYGPHQELMAASAGYASMVAAACGTSPAGSPDRLPERVPC